MNTFISDLSQSEFPGSERISAKTIRHPLLNLIQKENPQFTEEGFLSVSELNHYREKYISDYLVREMGELSELENTVISSLTDHSTLTDKIDGEDQNISTFGQGLADKVATLGGSWSFIIFFSVVLFLWIFVNGFWLTNRGFDPYPFIFLNLILSCLAAIQAPVIMMSQNRQEEKDRENSKKDYMINLKSELEIRILHEKLDHLIMHQQQDLLEIQKVQIEMMNDILKKLDSR
jgi:uncharacterized membrane protein